ncbi:hypothetical protein [Dyadobacter sp. CY312]|uniref:hypothetical protein n=1 Tax=Dyadobacter sp. CY312 TaxID=2907303 RepID=UPI001F24F9EB|nr:hypothetical protein [Dyadobacter sp. CY312]MCE7044062.1 hypothetical protein [Dyadobacter sp. CY312]
MFTTNPWVVYVSFLTPLLSLYYLAVGFIYYRQDLKARFRAWSSPGLAAADFHAKHVQNQYSQSRDTTDHDDITGPDSSQQAEASEEALQNQEVIRGYHELSLHLKQAIQHAHQGGYSKEELILLFQMTFKEYDVIYGTPFQLSVNDLIDWELEKYGSIHLNSEDRMRMWNQVD